MATALDGKFALVTAAAQGIGRAIALKLAAKGAAVALSYPLALDRECAEAVVREISALGGRAIALQADLACSEAIEAMFVQAGAAFGPLDIVVSIAEAQASALIVDVSEADYDGVTGRNARAHFFVLQHAARAVRNGGRIIYVGTGAGTRAQAGSALVGGANAACEIYAKVLSKEIGARGITVNAVSPGTAGGAVTASAADVGPQGRPGTPGDVADVVGFLAREQARWITGQTLHACGDEFA